jgi:hypothetical protein
MITVREKLARYCTGKLNPLGYCLRLGKKVQAGVARKIAIVRCGREQWIESNAAELYDDAIFKFSFSSVIAS